MKRVVKKLSFDGQTKRGIGFGLPINGPIVFNPTYTTKEQIKYNLINYLMTNKKERVFNNKFGANLRSLLFEGINFDNLDLLARRIEQDVKTYFPYIQVVDLRFNPEPNKNTVTFIFSYKIPGYNIEDAITIIID